MVAPEVTVNYLAVLVSGVIFMILGALWYGPLFGKQWMRLMGFGKKEMDAAKKKGMAKVYIINFIAALVTVWVLAYIVGYINAVTWLEGVQAGFWVWLGFFATTGVGQILWDGKPFKLYVINVGYHLVSLIIAGAILAVW